MPDPNSNGAHVAFGTDTNGSRGSTNSSQTAAGARRRSMSAKTRGLVVMTQSLLLVVPLLILGAAIDWPASLDEPASVVLPRIIENEGAVRFGYLVYLAYSVMFLPVAVIITRWLHRTGDAHPVVLIATGMAAASAALRAIGIIRWLAAMFPMAERWETADADTRTILALQFDTANDYGGAIGELLGVSLFAAAWLAVTVLGRSGTPIKTWIIASGTAAFALLLLPLTELAGFEFDLAITLSGVAITVWLFVIGMAIFRSPERLDPTPPAEAPYETSDR